MLNQKLRAAREKKLWTMAQAAEAIGVSEQTYSRWENGTRRPHLSTLKMLCQAFEASPGELGYDHLASRSTVGINLAKPETKSLLVTPATSTIDMFEIGLMALMAAQQQHHWAIEELHAQIGSALKEFDMKMAEQQSNQAGISRRHALGIIASLPLAVLGTTQVTDSSRLTVEEILPLYASSVPACWRLYFDGGITEVKRILPDGIMQLEAIVQHSATHQKMAAALASQAHQLSWLLALQHQDFSSALTATKQAFRYGDLADDNQLRVSSLVRQAHVYFHLRRPLQQLQIHQKALQYSNDVSPLLQGWLYVVLAESQAHLGQTPEALRTLGRASDVFPDHPEEDSNFSYVPVDHFFFANHTALAYLHLSQPVQAWDTLARIEKTVPTTLVPRRAELLCRQASASFHLGDLEQACTYAERAGTVARQLGSDLRFGEASETYQEMLLKWPQERKVKSLEELFRPF